MKYITTIIAYVLVFNASTSPAMADTIHACANNNNGKLRVVADPSQCNDKREGHISWNTEGPQGTQGEKGDEGDKGEPGEPTAAPARHVFVGFSALRVGREEVGTLFTSGAALFANPRRSLNNACHEQFVGSRMCTQLEIFGTSPFPEIPEEADGQGWIACCENLESGFTSKCMRIRRARISN